jgi:hypothetical protein
MNWEQNHRICVPLLVVTMHQLLFGLGVQGQCLCLLSIVSYFSICVNEREYCTAIKKPLSL